MKTGLLLAALALGAGLVLIGWRRDRTAGPRPAEGARGPAFVVRLERPRASRPLFGILPGSLEAKLLEEAGPPGFDEASPGAAVGTAGAHGIDLRAEGWALRLETDAEGRIAPGTRLTFPLVLGGRPRRLACRPAIGARGYLRTQAGPGGLDGVFLVELAHCVDADTGRALAWPPAPLTLQGRFARLSPPS